MSLEVVPTPLDHTKADLFGHDWKEGTTRLLAGMRDLIILNGSPALDALRDSGGPTFEKYLKLLFQHSHGLSRPAFDRLMQTLHPLLRQSDDLRIWVALYAVAARSAGGLSAATILGSASPLAGRDFLILYEGLSVPTHHSSGVRRRLEELAVGSFKAVVVRHDLLMLLLSYPTGSEVVGHSSS